MRLLDSRRDQSVEKRRKMTVDILGRGAENITVSPTNTVGDLRSSLSVGQNVRAVDGTGQVLSDTDRIGDMKEINFVPNVKGGEGEPSPPRYLKSVLSTILRQLLSVVEGTAEVHQLRKDDFRYSTDIVSPDTVFSCNRPPIKIIEEVGGNGLFPIGVRPMFEMPDLKTQYKIANKLKYVEYISENMSSAIINLKDFGRYEVMIEKDPIVYRRNRGKDTFANPYIAKDNNKLCLGNSVSFYHNCFLSGNYLESLKIIQEVLKSEPDGSQNIYRRWSEC